MENNEQMLYKFEKFSQKCGRYCRKIREIGRKMELKFAKKQSVDRKIMEVQRKC